MSEQYIVGQMKSAMETSGIFLPGSTITMAAEAVAGATTITVDPLPEIVTAANKTLWFTGGLTARVTSEVAAGLITIPVEPLRFDIPIAATAQYESSVTVNDWFFLDQPNENSPYLIFETADDFNTMRMGGTPNRTWQISMHPTIKWHEWQEALNEFRYVRERCIQLLSDTFLYPTDPRWKMVRTWSDESVYGRPDPYVPHGQIEDVQPIYVGQRIFIEVEDYDI